MTWQDWVELVTDVGFEVDTRSGPWRNDWVCDNVFAGLGTLHEPDGTPRAWPDTDMLLVGRRPAP